MTEPLTAMGIDNETLDRRGHGARSQSLRHNLLQSTGLVLAGTLLIGGLLTYWQAVSKIDTEVRSALQIAEKTVHKALPEIVRDDDPRLELVKLIRVFDGNRHVKARLVESEGGRRPDIESQPAFVGHVPPWFVSAFDKAPELVTISLPETLAPVDLVELATVRDAEIVEVWNEVLLKLAILMVFCGALGGLVYMTLGRALEPLTSLMKAFEHMGSGDYATRVPVNGPSELATLCEGFNAMAMRLGQMEARNQRLNEQLATVQEEERADLARDLHDEVSPFLFSVEVDAATIRQRAEASSAGDLAERADAIRDAVTHMKKHVRSILGRLRSTVHLELGLEHAVEALVASWRLRNPAVKFKLDIAETGLDQQLDAVIYGILREAIANALKHGKPSEIEVAVTRADDDGIGVKVRDNGRGLDESRSADGYGLVAMKERVAALRGALTVANRIDGAGVVVTASLPARPMKEARGVTVQETTQ